MAFGSYRRIGKEIPHARVQAGGVLDGEGTRWTTEEEIVDDIVLER